MTFLPDVPVLRGALVRLEPLSVSHGADLAAAAEEDRSAYGFTRVPRAWEMEDYLAVLFTPAGVSGCLLHQHAVTGEVQAPILRHDLTRHKAENSAEIVVDGETDHLPCRISLSPVRSAKASLP